MPLLKHSFKTSLALTAFTVISLATSQPAAAVSMYRITNLGKLFPNLGSQAFGINNRGQIVGEQTIAVDGQLFVGSEIAT